MYRWIMLSLIWLVYAIFGLATRTTASLATAISDDLRLSHTQMGAILGAWQAAYVIFALPAGLLLDRWGLSPSILLGSLIVAVSLVLRYWASGFLSILAFVALLGIGGPLISIGAPKLVSGLFRARARGVAVAFYSSAPVLGAVTAMSATHSVVMPLMQFSWRKSFVFYGLIAASGAILWGVAARDPRAPADGTGRGRSSGSLQSEVEIGRICVLLLIGFCTFAVHHGFSSWLPVLLEDTGLTRTAVGYAASLPGLVSLAAAISIPWLVPAHRRPSALRVIAAVSMILLMLVSYVSDSIRLAIVGMIGFGYGALLPVEMLILMETPGLQAANVGFAVGLFFCAGQIGGVSGPLLVGFLSDATGSFRSGMFALASLCLVILCLSVFVPAACACPRPESSS